MDLICYLHPGWEPLIRPAPATRAWMDNTPEAFAYRCLPLNIANAHGWEILTPMGFEARWNGGNTVKDVEIKLPAGAQHALAPVSLFGQGVLTFHIFGLFRTPPGWNLWVGGSPNAPKDGIYPLSGIVETDWSPYTFTMNWRFTRPGHWVRFDEKEPICFIYPVQRGYLDAVKPKLVPMESNADLMRQFRAWSASRDQFQVKVAKDQPAAGADKWQKRYYRGVDMDEKQAVPDHQIKPRLAEFAPADAPAGGAPLPREKRQPVVLAPFVAEVKAAAPAAQAAPAQFAPEPAAIQRALQSIGTELMFGAEPAPLVQRLIALGAPESEARRIIDTAVNDPLIVNGRAAARALRKRDWLLETMEKHWQLRPGSERIERRVGLSGEEFLDRYFAPGRPVILVGDMAEWPALAKWSPDYLRERIGARMIDIEDARTGNERLEAHQSAHRAELPFDRFIDMAIRPGPGNGACMTTATSARNAEAIASLRDDLACFDKLLDRAAAQPHGTTWIGPAGSAAPLRHDLTDHLFAQIVGRKRLKMVAAAEVAKIYNHDQVFSEIADLEDPRIDRERYPALDDMRIYDVTLSPGEALFVPIGWWHQAKALDFGVTIAYANFRWQSETYRAYPSG